VFKISTVDVVFSFSTSHLEKGGLECKGEVGGDCEGLLLLEWPIYFDLLTIHSSFPLSSSKNVDASKILAPTLGITTRSGP